MDIASLLNPVDSTANSTTKMNVAARLKPLNVVTMLPIQAMEFGYPEELALSPTEEKRTPLPTSRPTSLQLEAPTELEPSIAFERQRTCPTCAKTFRYPYLLRNHTNAAHPFIRRLPCTEEECRKSLVNRS
jgi:hypothetical protein